MSKYGQWTDDLGRIWNIPRPGKLNPTMHKSHAALRRFVFVRDNFTCQDCGATTAVAVEEYDGRWAVSVSSRTRSGYECVLHVDHRHPRSAGGGNHPDNLRACCESCNSRKAGRINA